MADIGWLCSDDIGNGKHNCKMDDDEMIAYHGTNRICAESIERHGFRKGTYFAFRRLHAIKFGGLFVFKVELSDDPELWKVDGGLMDLSKAGTSDCWQFHLTIPLSPSVILESGEAIIYRKRATGRLWHATLLSSSDLYRSLCGRSGNREFTWTGKRISRPQKRMCKICWSRLK